MAHEISIEEEDFIIAENRHDEIIKSLGKVAAALSNIKEDKAVADAIKKSAERQESVMGKVSTAIEKIKNLEVNVELDSKELLPLLRGIRDEQKANKEDNRKILQALENRLLPDTFTLIKGYGGVTESVKINYKKASQIQFKL